MPRKVCQVLLLVCHATLLYFVYRMATTISKSNSNDMPLSVATQSNERVVQSKGGSGQGVVTRLLTFTTTTVSVVIGIILAALLSRQATPLYEVLVPYDQPANVDTLPEGAMQIGPVNVLEYCLTKYGGHPYLRQVQPNPYAWRCQVTEISIVPTTIFYGVSFNEACREQYGEDAYSYPLDQQNPYSWKCFR